MPGAQTFDDVLKLEALARMTMLPDTGGERLRLLEFRAVSLMCADTQVEDERVIRDEDVVVRESPGSVRLRGFRVRLFGLMRHLVVAPALYGDIRSP